MSPSGKTRSSFTLIELLVVLALVAILSVVVVLTLNPAELIKQARDSNRLSDLSTINTALNLFSADVTSGFMGTSTVVYVSIPSASPTCSGLGLPTLPTGYTYNCATTVTLRNTDGTGWIPVNFQRISSNSPISQLPVDPTNTTSTGNYYIYMMGGSWELASNMESAKQKSVTGVSGTDGGLSLSSYEAGNNLRLVPPGLLEWKRDSSLVGYWTFDEGTSTTVYDHGWPTISATGGLNNGPTWSSGKVGPFSIFFDGANDYINLINSSIPKISGGEYTAFAWVNPTSHVLSSVIGGEVSMLRYFGINSSGRVVSHDGSTYRAGNTSCQIGEWCLFGIVVWNDYSRFSLIMNGEAEYTGDVATAQYKVVPLLYSLGSQLGGTARWFPGKIDDIRIYNRALSAAEILALYNATK